MHSVRRTTTIGLSQFAYDLHNPPQRSLSSFFQIGWYSEDEGLHLTSALDPAHLVTTQLPHSAPLIRDEQATNGDGDDRGPHARSLSEQELLEAEREAQRKAAQLDTLPIFSYESFISRTWALVVVSVAIFGVFVSLWMMFYVLQKICDGTLNGNQMMGVLLLCGVMGLFASVIPWLLPPNETVCAVRHFMHPLLLVVCFAILLVKSMQLRSLVTIGLGGSLPQVNQLVSLFFMIAIQVVIAVEWYFATRPVGVMLTDGYPECNVSKARFLLLHIYPAVLLVLSFIYAISVLKVKRNFNEGRWITCATLFIIPIFAAWPAVYYFAPVPFHDPSVAVSVLAVAGVLLAAIFLPKMNTISQQSHLKQCDMSRTNSDATVYTGFSDYVPFIGGGSRHQLPASKPRPVYPVYGYTTNLFSPATAAAPTPTSSRPSPSRHHKSSHKSKKRQHGGGNGGFNGLNYVSPPPNIKSFSEWSREYSPAATSAGYHQHTNNLADDYEHQQQQQTVAPSAVYRNADGGVNHYHNLVGQDNDGGKRRRKSSSGLRSSPAKEADEEVTVAGGRSSRKSRSQSRRSRSQASSSRYVDYASYVARQRTRRHSKSPSDGMILTAAGLADQATAARERSVDDDLDGAELDGGFRVSQVILTH